MNPESRSETANIFGRRPSRRRIWDNLLRVAANHDLITYTASRYRIARGTPRCKFLAKKESRVQLHENGEPPGAALFWSSGSAGRYYSKIRALLCSYATLVSISNAIPERGAL